MVGCATAPKANPDPRDPWEGFNRVSYQVTDVVDRAVLKPTARGYRKVAPQFVETGVANFFSNLNGPTVIVNDLLQAKFKPALNDTGRFLLNSTLGLGGLLDPASAAGLDRNDEDFGQTLGKWGVPSGPYLWIPFLGPSSARDAPGQGVDAFLDPVNYIERDKIRFGLTGLDVVDARSRQLDLEETLESAYDRYAFIRNAYLQQREYQVKDGDIPPPAIEEDEPLEDPEPDAPPPKK
jgi:phospholipid-binding lipoprotein MlaA